MREEYIAIIVLAIIGIGLSAIAMGYNFDYGTAETVIPIENKVERAIELAYLENKFVYVTSVGFFGGAGAGGLGDPQSRVESVEQFVELAYPKKPILSALEYGKTPSGYKDKRILKKVYWGFYENISPIIIYEDVYTHDSDGYGYSDKIERFNETEVVFGHFYGRGSKNIQTLCGLLGFILFILAIIGILDQLYKMEE